MADGDSSSLALHPEASWLMLQSKAEKPFIYVSWFIQKSK
jgi:hypothetical protein